MKYTKLADIQASKDRRGITINRVGITNIDFPIYIQTQTARKVLCYAKVSLYSSLVSSIKGTNMSRYIEVLMKWRYKSFSRISLWKFLYELQKKVETDEVYAEISFPYFIDKIAPVSKKSSPVAYTCSFIGHLTRHTYRFLLHVQVPVTSVCPCSKEISKYGAHGQRSKIDVTIESKRRTLVWFEDLIKLVEKQGSCEVFPVLKRVDEKFVTEKAYENPKFVEDIARDVALSLQTVKGVCWFKVRVQNYESIHNHDVVCYIERVKKGNRWRKSTRSLRSLHSK